MSLSPIPTDRMVDKAKKVEISEIWLGWFGSIAYWLFPIGQYGTTAKRPTKSLYIGQVYYDTTLGYPVWVHQVSPSIIWHNGAGAAV